MELYLNILLQIVFLLSVVGILHTYGIYPFLMAKLDFKGEEDSDIYTNEVEWPTLNVVMAMYNEETVIKETIESMVASDYPEGKLNIYIGSDNSTDRSHDIVEKLQNKHPFINLEVFEGRNGKIKIINYLVEQLPKDDESVLVLCDANVVWTPGLAENLARHFKDERIGVVASNVIDSDCSKHGIASQEEAYVNLENTVKHSEGIMWGRMMGAFGACYALRRDLYEPVPENFNVDDFYQTMACYEQGYDGIVDLDAVCYESVSEEISEEFRRKRRISKGNFQNLKRFCSYLLPWNCGLSTFTIFWSHKGLRWFGPALLLLIFVTSLILACQERLFYILVTLGIAGTFFATWLDNRMEAKGQKRVKLFKFIRYFYVMNYALFLGGIEYCKGVQDSVWQPTQRVRTKKSDPAPPKKVLSEKIK